MDIPLQPILLCIPSIIYIAVRKWRGGKWKDIFGNIGWNGSRPIFLIWALGVVTIVAGLGWLAFQTVPSDVLDNPNINISEYSGWTLSITSFLLVWIREAIYVAIGEEIFFRGFLGGWLFRRFGFLIGNIVQALIFILPHLLLLLVSLSFWPIVAVQMVAGWFLGCLRYRSDSILPGWLAHSLSNAIGALVAMN
jgi:membrane protease YdiL (CAAX protease family)